MITFLMIVWLKGNIVLAVPNIQTEKACYSLMEQIETDLPKWRKYHLQCYRVE
jgi:hypothetical protein